MPAASETRLIEAPAREIWDLVCDPYHLARWWPRVERVEGVQGNAFTEVLRSARGNLVRADFDFVRRDDSQMRLVWEQRIAGTPFARVLSGSETELRISPAAEAGAAPAAEVTVTLTQTPPAATGGMREVGRPMPTGSLTSVLLARLGSPMIRRAAARTVREALDGLQGACV